jgi:hypothetical protein
MLLLCPHSSEAKMSKGTFISPFFILETLILSGCGTHVPAIQEIGDDTQGVLLVQAIVGSIRCEIRNALAQIYWDDLPAEKANGHRSTVFLDKWGHKSN